MASPPTRFVENAAINDFSRDEEPRDHEAFIQRLANAAFMGPECTFPTASDEDNLIRHILSCQAALALILGKRKMAENKSSLGVRHQYLLAVSNISQVIVTHFCPLSTNVAIILTIL
jgi:hypothetical protein